MNVNNNKGYLHHIEGLRAIAAIMVMLFHFFTFHNTSEFLFKSTDFRFAATFGAQGVELFYIISGCVIAMSFKQSGYSIGDYPRYLLKRILRILPAYFVTILLICLLALVWKGKYPYSAVQILQNCTFTVDFFGGTWLNQIFSTLKVEFQFYILIGLLFPLLKKYSFIGFILVPAIYVASYLHPEIDILRNGPYFIIGILISNLMTMPSNRLTWAYLALCFCGLFPDYHLEDYAIVIIALVFLVFVKLRFNWLVFVGRFSYSLYLIHGLIGGTFMLLFTQEKYIKLPPAIAVIGATIVALIGAYFMYVVIEKRSLAWTKRIRYSKN